MMSVLIAAILDFYQYKSAPFLNHVRSRPFLLGLPFMIVFFQCSFGPAVDDIPIWFQWVHYVAGLFLLPYYLVLWKIWPFGSLLPDMGPDKEQEMFSFGFPFGAAFALAFAFHLVVRAYL